MTNSDADSCEAMPTTGGEKDNSDMAAVARDDNSRERRHLVESCVVECLGPVGRVGGMVPVEILLCKALLSAFLSPETKICFKRQLN